MTLISRLTRLFTADLHAVLDRIEEPEALLRQAIREMEEDLARDRRALHQMRSEAERLATRDDELARTLTTLAEELDICFAAAKEDLARALLRRRLETERWHSLLTQKRRELCDNEARLAARVAENAARLESMRQKAELLLAKEVATPRPEERWDGPELSIRAEDVEVAFLREQQRRIKP